MIPLLNLHKEAVLKLKKSHLQLSSKDIPRAVLRE